jgi:hypothetical protein
MTASEPSTGIEASDLGRFEPSPYDLGITDDPEPQSPGQADLWAAQNAPRIANAAGCADAEYERLLDERQAAEAAYLAEHGSLAPEPRTEAELAAAARAEAWGPQSPVRYSLTTAAEAALGDAAEEAELDAEAEADWAHEWDSADSAAYMDRVEAGPEPEAEP